MRSENFLTPFRSSRIESFEERLALSAQSVFSAALLASTTDPAVDVPDHEEVAPPVTEEPAVDAMPEVEAPQVALPEAPLSQDALPQQSLPQGAGLTGAGQTVVVIDSGVAYDHEAFGGRPGFGAGFQIVGGWDFAENDADPYDDGPLGFHGTHVAGVIAASHGERLGVAPGVDIVSLRVFDDYGSGDIESVEQALRWVHDNLDSFESPITTVNLSLGAGAGSDEAVQAALEDELRVLDDDGVFISVAAGNSFSESNPLGLSYPASSEFVTPVASVGEDGELSDFSQRGGSVIAAPGEQIVSAVPDHIFGVDGRINDYTHATGTSMAAPQVAGASVLLREAMQIAGETNIDQDAIYQRMVDTADRIYDPATDRYYHRLNVERAIQETFGADDFGDAGFAHSLGTVTSEQGVDGVIGRLDDVDSFTFTAGATGTAHISAEVSHSLVIGWQLEGTSVTGAGHLSFDVIAGQTYIVSAATTDGLGSYAALVSIEAAAAPPAMPPQEPAVDQPAEESEDHVSVEEPPANEPPVEEPPVEEPPVVEPPVVDQPPTESPPAIDPPANDPPTDDPPTDDPPADESPTAPPEEPAPPAEEPATQPPPGPDPAPDTSANAPVNLGAVDFVYLNDIDVESNVTFEFVAGHDGTLTIDASSNVAQGNIDLWLSDDDGNLVGKTTGRRSHEQMELQVKAGERYVLGVTGANDRSGGKFVNLVTINNRVAANPSAGASDYLWLRATGAPGLSAYSVSHSSTSAAASAIRPYTYHSGQPLISVAAPRASNSGFVAAATNFADVLTIDGWTPNDQGDPYRGFSSLDVGANRHGASDFLGVAEAGVLHVQTGEAELDRRARSARLQAFETAFETFEADNGRHTIGAAFNGLDEARQAAFSDSIDDFEEILSDEQTKEMELQAVEQLFGV